MEQLFNDLQQQIARKMGSSVSLIDEDYGQLEALARGDDQHPVTFPCVLIGIPEVKWNNLKVDVQKGDLTLTIRVAFDCYDDALYEGAQEHHAAERLHTAGRLNGCLHGWMFDGCAQVMTRTLSRQFSLPGGIKVYELQYATVVVEEEVQNSGS